MALVLLFCDEYSRHLNMAWPDTTRGLETTKTGMVRARTKRTTWCQEAGPHRLALVPIVSCRRRALAKAPLRQPMTKGSRTAVVGRETTSRCLLAARRRGGAS